MDDSLGLPPVVGYGHAANRIAAWLLAALLTPPLLYLVGLAPAVVLCKFDVISFESVDAAYDPLCKGAERVHPTLGGWVLSYWGWWARWADSLRGRHEPDSAPLEPPTIPVE